MKIYKTRSILRLATLCCCLFALVFSNDLQAQDQPENVFVAMWCIKAKTQDAMSLIKNDIKPFEESLIKKGLSMDWILMRTEFPSGNECKCDYYSMQVFSDHKLLEFFSNREKVMAHFTKTFPDKDPVKLMERFKAAIDDGGTQVYYLQDVVVPGPTGGQFVTVNYMNVAAGNEGAYAKMENEVFKPVHKEAVAQGYMKDWVLMQRIMPRGTDFDGNFITVDVHGSMENAMRPVPSEIWKKVHPDVDQNEMYRKMAKLRELKRAELWQFVMKADRPKEDKDATSSN